MSRNNEHSHSSGCTVKCSFALLVVSVLACSAQGVFAGDHLEDRLGCCSRLETLSNKMNALRSSTLSEYSKMEASTNELTARISSLTAKLVHCSTLRARAESELALLRSEQETPGSGQILARDERLLQQKSADTSAVKRNENAATWERSRAALADGHSDGKRDLQSSESAETQASSWPDWGNHPPIFARQNDSRNRAVSDSNAIAGAIHSLPQNSDSLADSENEDANTRDSQSDDFDTKLAKELDHAAKTTRVTGGGVPPLPLDENGHRIPGRWERKHDASDTYRSKDASDDSESANNLKHDVQSGPSIATRGHGPLDFDAKGQSRSSSDSEFGLGSSNPSARSKVKNDRSRPTGHRPNGPNVNPWAGRSESDFAGNTCQDSLRRTQGMVSEEGGKECRILIRNYDPNPSVHQLDVFRVTTDGTDVKMGELGSGGMLVWNTSIGMVWRVYESDGHHGTTGNLRSEVRVPEPATYENPLVVLVKSCKTWPLVHDNETPPQWASCDNDDGFTTSNACNVNHQALSKCDPMRYLSEIEPAPGLHIVCPLHLQPDEQVSYRCNPRMRLVIFKDAFYSNDGQCSTSLLVPKSITSTGQVVKFISWALKVPSRGPPGGGEFMPRMFTPGGKAFPYGDRAFDISFRDDDFGIQTPSPPDVRQGDSMVDDDDNGSGLHFDDDSDEFHDDSTSTRDVSDTSQYRYQPHKVFVRRGVGSPLLHRRSLFFIEGGNFVYPGVKIGHIWNVGPMLGIKDRPVGLKTLSLRPLIFEVKEFLTRAERVAIMETAEPRLKKAGVVYWQSDAGVSGGTNTKVRTNTAHYLSEAEKVPAVRRVEDRLMKLSRIPLLQAENVQVVRYELGQRYDPHWDYFDLDKYLWQAGFLQNNIKFGASNRHINMYMYLTGDDEFPVQGGNTSYPAAHRNRYVDDVARTFLEDPTAAQEAEDANAADIAAGRAPRHPEFHTVSDMGRDACTGADGGLAVSVESGKLLISYSLLPTGGGDLFSVHGGCPIISGTKWGANMWLWSTAKPEDRDPAIYEELSKVLVTQEHAGSEQLDIVDIDSEEVPRDRNGQPVIGVFVQVPKQ